MTKYPKSRHHSDPRYVRCRPYAGHHNRTRRHDCQISARILLVLICLTNGLPASAQSTLIEGRWLLDPAASDEAAKELKGIQVSKRKHRKTARFERPSGRGSATQERYWQQANAGKEWRHSRALAHAGPIQRLLESENLEIVPNEHGFIFIYADGFERSIVPNPGGRVFTAKGDELVQTDIGYTLAYWKNENLVFETRIEAGGKLTERLSTSEDGNNLTVNIEVDRRDWKRVAKLERVFKRVER